MSMSREAVYLLATLAVVTALAAYGWWQVIEDLQ